MKHMFVVFFSLQSDSISVLHVLVGVVGFSNFINLSIFHLFFCFIFGFNI
ncbi:hypothetical protein JHK86_050262 [Glycine max]|nr:hypothetical protein JHK86_050262 [Glycine max]